MKPAALDVVINSSKQAAKPEFTRSGLPMHLADQASAYLEELRRDKAPVYAKLNPKNALPLPKVKRKKSVETCVFYLTLTA